MKHRLGKFVWLHKHKEIRDDTKIWFRFHICLMEFGPIQFYACGYSFQDAILLAFFLWQIQILYDLMGISSGLLGSSFLEQNGVVHLDRNFQNQSGFKVAGGGICA